MELPVTPPPGSVHALIPVKLDSERLSGKNLRLLAGKSLLQHAVDYLGDSSHIRNLWISTDRPGAIHVESRPNIRVVARGPRLCGDAYLCDVYRQWFREWAPDSMQLLVTAQCDTPLRPRVDLDELIQIAWNRLRDGRFHELITTNGVDRVGALTIYSREALERGIMSGYLLRVELPDTHGRPADIHTERDLAAWEGE